MSLLFIWIGLLSVQLITDAFLVSRLDDGAMFVHRLSYSALITVFGWMFGKGRSAATYGLMLLPVIGALTTRDAFIQWPESFIDAFIPLLPLALLALAIGALKRRGLKNN